jgi:hypothetical protein
LAEAYRVFQALRVPRYEERTEALARRLEVSLSPPGQAGQERRA